MFDDVIGIVGGMGSYATLSFFERLLDAFPGEKEWDRPRIIIDNRCTMPSRVRAILYSEKVDELEWQLADSVQHLIDAGANKIILACNTSHHFVPRIYELTPSAKGRIISIIEATKDYILEIAEEKSVNLLASEGTIDIKIFHHALEGNGIQVLTPTDEEFGLQRVIIESVKRRKITHNEVDLLQNLICNAPSKIVILGCTEFPVIYKEMDKKPLKNKIVVDPLQCVIDKLVKELK